MVIRIAKIGIDRKGKQPFSRKEIGEKAGRGRKGDKMIQNKEKEYRQIKRNLRSQIEIDIYREKEIQIERNRYRQRGIDRQK